MEGSFENMCRTCMNENKKMFSIFSIEKKLTNKCYADILMSCASLQIEQDDDLPQNICQYCLNQLLAAYVFKQQSERSEATLREITKNPNIEFIKEGITDDFTKTEIIQSNKVVEELHLDETKDEIATELQVTEEFLEKEFMDDDEILDQSESSYEYLESIRQYLFNSKEILKDNVDDIIIVDIKQEASPALDLSNSEQNVDTELLKNKQTNSRNAKTFKSRKTALKPKTNSHSNKLTYSKELKCMLCNQTFKIQQVYKKHIKMHMKKLRCEICLKDFRSTHGLRYHMKIHSGIKNYVCNFENCTKRFRLKQALDKHLSIHNSEKNHLCSLCGKTYNTYDALYYHLRVHRGERPYLCIHCGKTFKQSCHLKTHMWIHSGIKPHVCKFCDKCYTSGYQLKKHSRKHANPSTASATP